MKAHENGGSMQFACFVELALSLSIAYCFIPASGKSKKLRPVRTYYILQPDLEDLAREPLPIAVARQELVAAEWYLEELVGVEWVARFALEQLPSMLREARRNVEEKNQNWRKRLTFFKKKS